MALFHKHATPKEKSIIFQQDLRRWYDAKIQSSSHTIQLDANTLVRSISELTNLENANEFYAFMQKGVPLYQLASLIESTNEHTHRQHLHYMVTKYWLQYPDDLRKHPPFVTRMIWTGLCIHNAYYSVIDNTAKPASILLTQLQNQHRQLLDVVALPAAVYNACIYMLNSKKAEIQNAPKDTLDYLFSRLQQQSTPWWRKQALTHIDLLYNTLDHRTGVNNGNTIPSTYFDIFLNLNADALQAVKIARDMNIPWQVCANMFEQNTLGNIDIASIDLPDDAMEALFST